MATTQQTVAKRLRAQRLEMRVTARAIAAELGVHDSGVNRFELYGAPLPKGLTVQDYTVALAKLVSA